MRAFLEAGGFGAFTTTFEDLHGLKQLPGLACQRLMADGYGFGAEGDWKTVRPRPARKVMTAGPARAASPSWRTTRTTSSRGRSASSARTCSRSALRSPTASRRSRSIPLGIGGKADPCRLVFDAGTGPAVNTTLVDMGGRMRMIVNELDVGEARPADAQAARGARRLDPAPRLQARLRGLDPGRRRPSRAFSQAVTVGARGGLRRHGGRRAGPASGRRRTSRALKNELRWNDVAYKLSH